MKTTDFSGTYDYEREEARAETDFFKSIETETERQSYVARLAKHWHRVLCAEGYADFRDEWNKLNPEHRID